MYRSARALAGLFTAALIVSALTSAAGAAATGCAMSSPADLMPGIDPSLPSLDAGTDPHPAAGVLDGGPGARGSSGSSGGTDSGPQGITADSGPVDAAPPPPPIPRPAAGEILISEIMYTTFTPEPASEWIELHSAATNERSLSGLTLKDGGGRTHVIAAGLTIAPGEYVVLARNKAAAISAKVPSGVIVYEYGTGLPDTAGIILANGATGGLSLSDGATVLANVPYGDAPGGAWFSQSGGSSIQLKTLDAALEATKSSWCLSLNAWATGAEKGTPGAIGDCP